MIVAHAPSGDRGFWPALAYGLRPLGTLVLSLLVWLGVLLAAQYVMTDAGFLTQRLVGTIILVFGLLQGAITFLWLARRVLKQVGAWQETDATSAAWGALVALMFSAVVVALPILLGLVLPQSPAP